MSRGAWRKRGLASGRARSDGFARVPGFALAGGLAFAEGSALEEGLAFAGGLARAAGSAFTAGLLLVAAVFPAAGRLLFAADFLAAGFLAADVLAGAFSGLILGSGYVSASAASDWPWGGTTAARLEGSPAPFKGFRHRPAIATVTRLGYSNPMRLTSPNLPQPAVAVSLWGQDLSPDAEALARLRSAATTLRLYAICIAGAEPPDAVAYDRVIRLPLDRQHLAYAEAIGLQLCFNEGCTQAGTLRSLAAADLDSAARHFAKLPPGPADAVVVADTETDMSRLFLSRRAAFLASCWAALAGELGEHRLRIAAILLGLAGRTGVAWDDPARGYAPLPARGVGELAPLADALRRKLGLFIGDRVPPRVKPVRRVAVVSPYYKEPDSELRRLIASVAAQTSPCHHILVSDGFPNALCMAPGLTHIELGAAHGDNGNTPRYVGALVALAQGYDAVAFLDADNWLEPKHIERLVARQHETGAAAVFSRRNVYLPDGTRVPGNDAEDESLAHVDTSCMFITRDCEYALHLWGQMPREWGPLCDRVVYWELNGQRLAWTKNRTMNFKSHYANHYWMAGLPIPPDVHGVPDELIAAFLDLPPEFRARSVSRTGRVITALGRR